MLQNNQNKNLVLIEDLGMLYPTVNSKLKARFGLFKCYCGEEFRTQMSGVKRNTTKSCGCLHKEKTVSHGMTKHRIYHIWIAMMSRCNKKTNKDYKDYGGRGIKVCEEWLDVRVFIKDMFSSYKEGLTIDRIESGGDYCLNNCRWVNQTVQNQNTRVIRRNNTSGYRGVVWHKRVKKWASSVQVEKKRKNLGYFNNAKDGAIAYNNYVLENNLIHPLNII